MIVSGRLWLGCTEIAGPCLAQRVSEAQARLTPREKEVLDYLVAGRSLKQIAARLEVTVQSIWKHRQRILGKFRVENEVQLVQLMLGKEPDCCGAADDAP